MRAVCHRCMTLAKEGGIRAETVQPLHAEAARNPLAHDGSGPCCSDCGSADSLARYDSGCNFEMARTAVGNCRQESLRLPGMSMGLVKAGFMHASESGDLDRHHKWLDKVWPEWMEETI